MKTKIGVIGLCCMILLSGCGTNVVAGCLAEAIADQIDDMYATTKSPADRIDADWVTETTNHIVETVPDSVYAEIYQAIASEDYRLADEKTEAAISQYEETEDFEQLKESIHSQWTEAVLSEASNVFGPNRDYEAAIRVIQESGLIGEEIDAAIAEYQEYAPVLLKELMPTKESDYMFVGAAIEGDYTDVNGNTYDKNTIIRPRSRTSNDIAKSEADSYVTYYLYGTYRCFDATLYRTYSSLSTLKEDWEQGTTAKIYGDDVLLYEGPPITEETYEQYSIHLDITGVRELKIVLMGVGRIGESYALYHYYPLLAIANATIQK